MHGLPNHCGRKRMIICTNHCVAVLAKLSVAMIICAHFKFIHVTFLIWAPLTQGGCLPLFCLARQHWQGIQGSCQYKTGVIIHSPQFATPGADLIPAAHTSWLTITKCLVLVSSF